MGHMLPRSRGTLGTSAQEAQSQGFKGAVNLAQAREKLVYLALREITGEAEGYVHSSTERSEVNLNRCCLGAVYSSGLS